MPKTEIIRTRVSPQEKAAIERQARKQDRDVSGLLRHLLRPLLEADEREQIARRSA